MKRISRNLLFRRLESKTPIAQLHLVAQAAGTPTPRLVVKVPTKLSFSSVGVVSANHGDRISRSRASFRGQSRPRHCDRTARFGEPAGPPHRFCEELLSPGSRCIAVLGTAPGNRIARFEQRSGWDRSPARVAKARLGDLRSLERMAHSVAFGSGSRRSAEWGSSAKEIWPILHSSPHYKSSTSLDLGSFGRLGNNCRYIESFTNEPYGQTHFIYEYRKRQNGSP